QAALRTGTGDEGGPAVAALPPAIRSAAWKPGPVPTPPVLGCTVLGTVRLGRYYPYFTFRSFLASHSAGKARISHRLPSSDPKVLEVNEALEQLKRELVEQRLFRADGLYRFYRAAASGDDLLLFEDTRELARFRFPRQSLGERLCLADYVRDVESGEADYVALFAVTCGAGVRELAERWKNEGSYLRSHMLQALAIECAEAFAEMLHARLRTQWGFPDPPDMALLDKLKAHYRGIRVSFGYPACPDLSDQRVLFDLLRPEQIGLGLTEGFM